MSNEKHITKRKRFELAVRIIQLARYLQTEKDEYILSKQILRSGTSIGADIEEASAGQSRRDFRSKMSIASKEARETMYWLRLMKKTRFVEKKLADSLFHDCSELVSLLTSIVKTTAQRCEA